MPPRLLIWAAVLMLAGASLFLVANAADTAGRATPAAASQEEQTGGHQDSSKNQSGSQVQDPSGTGAGHQDVPGAPEQTGDKQN